MKIILFNIYYLSLQSIVLKDVIHILRRRLMKVYAALDMHKTTITEIGNIFKETQQEQDPSKQEYSSVFLKEDIISFINRYTEQQEYATQSTGEDISDLIDTIKEEVLKHQNDDQIMFFCCMTWSKKEHEDLLRTRFLLRGSYEALDQS